MCRGQVVSDDSTAMLASVPPGVGSTRRGQNVGMAWKRREPSPTVDDDAASSQPTTTPRTRLSTTWTFAALGAVVLILLLVFILQNTQQEDLQFLWLEFRIPVGVGLLLAGAIGALLVVLIGASRLLQLRLAARRRRPHDR